MGPEKRHHYGPRITNGVVWTRPFMVDGVWKRIVHLDDGTEYVEVLNETGANARSPLKGAKRMDFPELEELATTEGAPTDVVVDAKPVAEKVCFLGVGQAGCKIADVMYEKGYRRVLLINTTEQDMAGLACPNRLLIGKSKNGAGKNPAVGAQAATDSREEILRAMYVAFGSDFDRIIVTTSGGGGTGSGATPVLFAAAQDYCTQNGKDPRVGVIAMGPKKTEGEAVSTNHRKLMAELAALKPMPLILVDNDRISKLYPKTPIANFYSVCNQNIAGLYNVFNELAAQPSPYATLDPADYKSILNSGVIVLGMTSIADADDPNAMAAAVEKNIAGGLLSDTAKIQGATHAGAILVASEARLATLAQSNLDRAFDALGRVIGAKGLMVHSGVYRGPDKLENRVLLYCLVGGLTWSP